MGVLRPSCQAECPPSLFSLRRVAMDRTSYKLSKFREVGVSSGQF